jgi:hypothetical protein
MIDGISFTDCPHLAVIEKLKILAYTAIPDREDKEYKP